MAIELDPIQEPGATPTPTEDERERLRQQLFNQQLQGLTAPAETTSVNTGTIDTSAGGTGELEQVTREDVAVPLREVPQRVLDFGRRTVGGLVRGTNDLYTKAGELEKHATDFLASQFGDIEDENSFAGWWAKVSGPRLDEDGNVRSLLGEERIDDVFGAEGESPYLLSSLAEGVAKAIPAYAAVTVATGGTGAFTSAGTAVFTRAGLKLAAKRIGLEGLRGAVADAITWDAYEERVTDMLENADIPVVSAVSALLAAGERPENPEWYEIASEKFKQAAEGFMTGVAIDGFLNAGRGYFQWRRLRRMRRAGRPIPELENQANEVVRSLEKNNDLVSDETFQTRKHAQGYEVVHKDATEPGARPTLYRTFEEADAVAARLNFQDRATQGIGATLDGAQTATVRMFARELATAQRADLFNVYARNRSRFNYRTVVQEAGPQTDFLGDLAQEGVTAPAGNPLLAIAEQMPVGGKDLDKMANDVAGSLFEGMKPDKVKDAIFARFPDADVNQIVFATKYVMDGLGQQVDTAARLATAYPNDGNLMQELGRVLTYAQDMADDILSTSSRAPRGKVKVAGLTAPVGSPRVLEGLSPREMRLLSRRVKAAEGNMRGVFTELKAATLEASGVIKRPRDPSFLNKLAEYRVNGMVSALLTTTTNVLSGSMQLVFDPLARLAGGLRVGDSELAREGVDLFIGNMRSVFDAFSAFRKAYKAGDSVFATASQSNIGKAFRTGIPVRDLGGTAAEELQERALGGLWGGFINLPRKFLIGGDEVIRTIAGRSWVRSQALKAARQNKRLQALPAKQRRLAMHRQVEQELSDHVNDLGEFTRMTGAQSYARDITFTQTLGKGTWGHSFAEMMNNHPTMRLIHPFHRIAVNLFRKAWAMSPVVGKYAPGVAEDLAAGGTRAAVATARMEVGSAVYAMGGYLAVSGAMTGGGPRNAVMREQWSEAGNNPYHLTVGGKQFDMRRLYPFSAPLMMVADLVQWSDYMDEDQLQQGPLAVMSAVATAITQPTFMSGITDFMEAVRGDEQQLRHFMETFGKTLLPQSSFFKGVNPDEVMRESQNVIAEMLKFTPFISEGLEADRNVLGEQVLRPPGYLHRILNPFQPKPAAAKNEPLLNELLEIGKAMPMFNPDRGDGIDMRDRDLYRGSGEYASSRPDRQSPYDRMMEIQNTTLIDGQTMRQALQELVDSPDWAEMSSGTSDRPGGERWLEVSMLVEGRNAEALGMVLDEYPLLAIEIERQQALRGASIEGQAEVDTVNETFDHLLQLPPGRR